VSYNTILRLYDCTVIVSIYAAHFNYTAGIVVNTYVYQNVYERPEPKVSESISIGDALG